VSDQIEIRIPDIGDFEDVEVVEILVAPGDRVQLDEPLVSIESDKATMEVPSPAAGEIIELRVSLGDAVSEGTVLAILSVEATEAVSSEVAPAPDEDVSLAEPPAEPATPGGKDSEPPAENEERGEPAAVAESTEEAGAPSEGPGDGSQSHAGPGVRRFARELGVDLKKAAGTGPHGRILNEDVQTHVRSVMQNGPASGRGGIPTVPAVDFSQYGPVEEVPLPRIRRVAAGNLSRSWLNAPHVTQHDEADVTALETFRRECKAMAAERDIKLSPLHFVLKAVAVTLSEFPDFRSSLSPDGQSLQVKGYFHLGVAVDTEHGLVVPVLRNVDQKGIFELARELADVAEKARLRKLKPADMQGAVFSLSSLGGIGGTSFTPIVNVPEVSILGLSKLRVEPRWSGSLDPESGGEFVPRTILPLSLSYDHRVIDGAAAARFTTRLAQLLSDPAYLLL
jgi:pyruvate dehydrogenase E2 component (dihydrolipoamide acetyltransferase)